MKIPSLARRTFIKKLIGVSVSTSLFQVLGIGNLSPAKAQATDSFNSQDITPFNLIPRLEYDYLSPMLKGIGEGVGSFARGAGEGAGDVARGIGEGLGERLRDLLSNSEGKRKLYEYAQEQDFRRKRELIELMRDSTREFQAKEIELKLTEIQSNWDLDNWNGILSRQETEDLLSKQNDTLLILLSPPAISPDAPASIRNNLELELRSVEAFLARYYPEQHQQHPIKFYSGYFKRPINDLNVAQLYRLLAPIPTAILYMDITDYACTFRIGFWGIQSKQVSFVASEAWNWENAKNDLISTGTSETEALRLIRKMIVTSHKLFAAYLADLYYLSLDPYYELQLPKLNPEFVREGLTKEWLDLYPNQLKDLQKQEQVIYDQELAKVVDKAKNKMITDSYIEAILQVLEQDKRHALARKSGSKEALIFANEIQKISLENCPTDFQQAFTRHNFVWFVYGSEWLMNNSRDSSKLRDSWQEVLQIAAKYGVNTEGF